ncbi:MAG: LytTR family DNA-binding domain-containing protein [Coriobacteriales bacterium]|nr:LytTR family DNA-binding domain-containing protein [Coriobacteriales bacterium]
MLKAIIVDDEAPARSELHFLLDETKMVQVVAEAANVREAMEKIHKFRCDILFLDVNMPGVNGIELAESLRILRNPPYIIFVTAYSEYAVKAFEINVTDYLVKPVETERLIKSINKVKSLIASSGKPSATNRIAVEKGGKKLFVSTDKIRYIMSKDDYSYIYTKQDRYLSTESLAHLEEKLETSKFFRVHRRYLVNLNFVSAVETASGGTLLLQIKGEEEKIPVSRRRCAALKKTLDL